MGEGRNSAPSVRWLNHFKVSTLLLVLGVRFPSLPLNNRSLTSWNKETAMSKRNEGRKRPSLYHSRRMCGLAGTSESRRPMHPSTPVRLRNTHINHPCSSDGRTWQLTDYRHKAAVKVCTTYVSQESSWDVDSRRFESAHGCNNKTKDYDKQGNQI